MELKFGWENLEVGDTSIQAFMSSYVQTENSAPAVVLVQEVWGVNDHMEDVAIRLAKAGYSVVAPDLLSLGGLRPHEASFERVEEIKGVIDTLGFAVFADEQKRQEAFKDMDPELVSRLIKTQEVVFSQMGKRTQYVETIKSIIAGCKANNSSRKVGAVGFCMGGGIVSTLVCSDSKLDVGVSFYGSVPTEDIMDKIGCPLLGIYAGEDPGVNSGIEPFRSKVKEVNGDYRTVIYPKVLHGFNNDTRPAYSIDAARDAWARTLTMLSEFLGENYADA